MPLSDFTYDTGAAVEPTVQERWALVSDDSIPYLVAGNTGRAVLLVHGAGASRRDWKDVIPVLAQFNRVYAPDLIGFGDAPRRELPHTPGYIADFLVAFMDRGRNRGRDTRGPLAWRSGLPGGGAEAS